MEIVKLVDGFYVDINGNRWNSDEFDEGHATELSMGLSYCHNCTDCYNCVECTNCVSCGFCLDCKNCTDCLHCTECENCENASRCERCEDCKNCWHCVYCTESTDINHDENVHGNNNKRKSRRASKKA